MPTRELAQQTAREAEWLVRYLDVSVVSLVGGLEMSPQLRALREGAAIVVGTPGRTRDHIERGSLRTEGIRCVVLDEGEAQPIPEVPTSCLLRARTAPIGEKVSPTASIVPAGALGPWPGNTHSPQT